MIKMEDRKHRKKTNTKHERWKTEHNDGKQWTVKMDYEDNDGRLRWNIKIKE